MANFRLPFPTCASFGHPGIDEGTLCRNLSALPGTIERIVNVATGITRTLEKCAALLRLIRETADSATQSAKDAVVLGWDAMKLYTALEGEGLLFVLDCMPANQIGPFVSNWMEGKKNPLALGYAQAFDKRVNGMGTLHNEFGRKHRVRAMLPFDKLAEWFAGDDAMKAALLDHYINRQGADRTISLDEMKLMRTYFDIFEIRTYSPGMAPFIKEATKGSAVKAKASIKGQNDALGNFTIHLDGTVKPASGAPQGPTSGQYFKSKAAAATDMPLVFEGRMDWYDWWDFDSKVALKVSGEATGRPGGADIAVAAVAALVDGVPFHVRSAGVPVTQFSGRFPVY